MPFGIRLKLQSSPGLYTRGVCAAFRTRLMQTGPPVVIRARYGRQRHGACGYELRCVVHRPSASCRQSRPQGVEPVACAVRLCLCDMLTLACSGRAAHIESAAGAALECNRKRRITRLVGLRFLLESHFDVMHYGLTSGHEG